MDHSLSIELPDLAATNAFGRRLADLLQPGDVIALIGPLGAGKTHLVRAIAAGLGVADERLVNSPTFVLIQEYQARLPIYHFDAYRLNGPGDFHDLGAHEYLEGRGICLIEWADRIAAYLPEEHLRIVLEITGESSRRVHVEGIGNSWEKRLLASRERERPEGITPL